ncbi:class I SAM-dependent methyltransferase [Vibrio ostreicida]|uniref:class I SAM-dependent methyltransferase n=1 Tax=Vibrio ostreicida TaxID=526588 RepID=UPI000970B48E|nr:class I SAM-dependent methyltransferase [Vibrio ostreicida]
MITADRPTYTKEEIEAMTYFDLIGVVRETNRPPGGANSIQRLAQSAMLSPQSRILEVGTSTGFTAIELARITGCQVDAIDINEESLGEARARAKRYGVEDRVTFSKQDATMMEFENETFDMVFCGNVTSYMDNKEKVIGEYCRVLKPNGYVAAIPMYYIDTPTTEFVNQVGEAIGVNLTPNYRQDCLNYYQMKPLDICWSEDYQFDNIAEQRVAQYVEELTTREHLSSLDASALEALVSKYSSYMHLFRENLAMMGYTLILLRKEPVQIDKELFTSTVIVKPTLR